jgi:glycosyltransferase involved in cell wall biosynthesis
MFASVVIPTHNRRGPVVRAVAALLKQDYPAHSYEVIVCCDRCTDGTPETLQACRDARVQVLDSEVPGQAGALNTGLGHARGEIVVFLDDEVEASPELVSAYVQAYHEAAGSKIAVTGYSEIPVRENATPLAMQLARFYESYFREMASEGHRCTPGDFCGSNCSAPAAAVREAGGFSESYFHERIDFELAVRLTEMGYQFRFCPRARGTMHLAVSGNLLVSRAANNARNDCRLARQHPWCVPHLSFFSHLQKPASRRKWRLLWRLGRSATVGLATLRRLSPDSLRLVNLECAARYCLALREELTDWTELCKLCQIR